MFVQRRRFSADASPDKWPALDQGPISQRVCCNYSITHLQPSHFPVLRTQAHAAIRVSMVESRIAYGNGRTRRTVSFWLCYPFFPGMLPGVTLKLGRREMSPRGIHAC